MQKTLGRDHASLTAFERAKDTYEDRQLVKIARAHHVRRAWLWRERVWSACQSLDVFEFATTYGIVMLFWIPQLVSKWTLLGLTLSCMAIRQAQTRTVESYQPRWLLARFDMAHDIWKFCQRQCGIVRIGPWRIARSSPGAMIIPRWQELVLATILFLVVCGSNYVTSDVFALAALPVAGAWEVRTTGNDNSGGGFRAGGSGTDRSQQDAAQVVIDNGIITTSITTNVITFTAGYTPTAADVNNFTQMLTGTNVTVGVYEITGQTGTTWTMDRNVVTAGTTTNATGNMGGALASPGKMVGFMVAGNAGYLKNGTYMITSATANVANGTLNVPGGCKLEGYQTTRGDLGTRPQLTASGISTFTLIDTNGNDEIVNLSLSGASLTSSKGIAFTQTLGYRLNVSSCTNGAFATDPQPLIQCSATACSTAIVININAGRIFGCEVYSNTWIGVTMSSANALSVFSLAYSNSGASSDGFLSTGVNAFCINCVAYGNGRDGFRGTAAGISWTNCIAEANTGYGFNNSTNSGTVFLLNAATYNNTSGATNGTLSYNITPVVGTASFFTNAAGGDLSLNNTAGGGADLRSIGYPGAFPAGTTTGYLDIGAVRHQDPAGGSGVAVAIFGG